MDISENSTGYLTIKELRESFGFGEIKMKSIIDKLIQNGEVEIASVVRKSNLNDKNYKSTGYKTAGTSESASSKISLSNFKKLIEKAEAPTELTDKESSTQFKSDLETRKMKFESSNVKQKYKAALAEIEMLDKRVDVALGITSSESKTFGKTIIKPPRKNEASEATAFMIASDWHIEERVDPKVINSINEYTPEIATVRANNFFINGARLIEIQRSGVNIDTLVLGLLGDIINGYIHEEFIEDNFMSPTEAIIMGEGLICSGIDYMLKTCNFKKIIIPCSYGNHGRTTIKSRVSTGFKNSFEWLMYQHLKKYYRHEKRVEFIVADGYFNYIDVYGYVVRFHHGDYMKYGGGVGGITISVNKAINQWNKTRWADLDVFGHWHQLIDGGNFICNGSLIGYNAFANMIKASYEPPKQAFFLVDNKRGKTICAPIHVEESKGITRV